MQKNIIIRGARQHNLKNINVEIPRDKFVVITGLSGSGKSSLAFDTIYAEGQRRYVESLSSYARQFLGQMDKPDVDYIEGLSPAISIDQKTTSRNPRSTVGTVTEIYDYLRLLFARAGIPHCPQCSKVIERQSIDQMVDRIMELPKDSKILILAPIVRSKKGEHQKVLETIKSNGYARVKVDNNIYTLDEEITLTKNRKHSIAVVVDRLVVHEDIQQRLAESLETALSLADGTIEVEIIDGETLLFSELFACPTCNINLPEIEPRLFSFNSPFGACPACTGLGVNIQLDMDLVMPDHTKKFIDGAIMAYGFSSNVDSYFMKKLDAVLDTYGFSINNSFSELSQEVQEVFLYGAGERRFAFNYESMFGGDDERTATFDGIINMLNKRYREASDTVRQEMENNYMSSIPCPVCHGARLKPETLAIIIGGKNIQEVTALTVLDAEQFFLHLQLNNRQEIIARQILKEINARLKFLNDVGLDYLTLDRAAGTLSGGEAQRIRLATQIGSGLVGVLYILDEPSIGLHQRDNARLLSTLKHLRDIGNTLIVVEHDEETMYAADHIIDIGPYAGAHGGEVVAEGDIDTIKNSPASITGQYLSGKKFIPIPKVRRKADGRFLEIRGAQGNNLRNINVKIPLGLLTVVTGVSGSGKSTLINDILYNSLANKIYGSRHKAGTHKEILGIEQIDKIINVDQSPIGRTPRSNPATYTGVFDFIRDLFSQTNEAKIRGYRPGRFSFNVKGGRCEACRGDGMNKIEMHFLPDVYVPCEICNALRYNRETLEIKYKGKNIAEVLDMTVEDAVEFFKNLPRIHRKLSVLNEVGLSYIKLGQAATTLSGGEAQRVKLATELAKRSTGKTLYILDEPTTGLHIADTHKLLEVLQKLVDGGDSVIVIEHNLDVIKNADHIIDLGPEGGNRGGLIVASGTPEQVAKVKSSYTGQFLRK